MTTLAGPSPFASLVDETRLGSAGGQALTGVAGIVLAVILIVGQISLATTKGIAVHLEQSVDNITEGNTVLESVIERSSPTSSLPKVLDEQARTLGSMQDAMVRTNAELDQIGATTGDLGSVVGQMQGASSELATTVAELDTTTQGIVTLLGGLPSATERTAGSLGTINEDMTAINAQLDELSKKLVRYGLPRAAGAKVP